MRDSNAPASCYSCHYVFVAEPGPGESRRHYRAPISVINEFGSWLACDLCSLQLVTSSNELFTVSLVVNRKPPAAEPKAYTKGLSDRQRYHLGVMAALDMKAAGDYAIFKMPSNTQASLEHRGLIKYDEDLKTFVLTAGGRAVTREVDR